MVQPTLEATGLKAGIDFYLAFSPERVDPGNEKWQTKNIPKVVGGIDKASTDAACAFYGSVVDTVVPVAGTRVAEMVKLLENTFRAVTIGMVNELALMCHRMGIDVWEVIDAAKTKPFGFMPFYPGPGLGGHCIPIDPFYLSWKAKQFNFEARFIELAGAVNSAMPEHVITRVTEALNSRRKAVNGSKVLLFGVAYKKDIDDVRESPALDIIELLHRYGAEVHYVDPHVPSLRLADGTLESVPMAAAMQGGYDCAVIVADHSVVDYDEVLKAFPLVVDTRNALKGRTSDKIFRL
jgi:UDP-N-acetyl-D-glucosamine dehydrogenase